MLKAEVVAVAGVAVAALVIAYYLKKKAESAVAAVGEVAGELWDASKETADAVVAKPALAIGDAIGVPRTNETECEKAKREGRTWDASFACPAGDFLSYVFN